MVDFEPTTDPITRHEFDRLGDIFGAYPIVAAYLFGARAHNAHRPYDSYNIAGLFHTVVIKRGKKKGRIIRKIIPDLARVFGEDRTNFLPIRGVDVGFQYRIIEAETILYCTHGEQRRNFERQVREQYNPEDETLPKPPGEPEIQRVRKEIVRLLEPDCLFLFGPCARGDQTPFSPIKLLAITNRPIPPIQTRMNRCFKNLKVDITMLSRDDFHRNKQDPESPAYWAIREEGRLLYGNPSRL